MIDLYYWTPPNGHKITIFLEETGLPYKIFPINIGKGEQFQPHFLKVSPNNRIPAILDHEPKGGGTPISVFDGFREALAANRAEFFEAVASGPFYGFNREGVTPSQPVIDNW